jgi:hypothetical protein
MKSGISANNLFIGKGAAAALTPIPHIADGRLTSDTGVNTVSVPA